MRCTKNDEPDVIVLAIQIVGGFTRQGRRWPPGSWLVHEPGIPDLGAFTPRRFQAQFTAIQPARVAA